MAPKAITKAESLLRFAKQQGAPLHEFTLAVTLGEAYELLDYLLEQHDNPMLRQDISEAKLNCDPWTVLGHFQLMGFGISNAVELH